MEGFNMAKWYYYQNSQKIGPVSSTLLKQLAKEGIITPQTLVETESGKQGYASDVKNLWVHQEPPVISRLPSQMHSSINDKDRVLREHEEPPAIPHIPSQSENLYTNEVQKDAGVQLKAPYAYLWIIVLGILVIVVSFLILFNSFKENKKDIAYTIPTTQQEIVPIPQKTVKITPPCIFDRSWEKLPKNFMTYDAQDLYEGLADAIPGQDDFETENEYQERVERTLNGNIYKDITLATDVACIIELDEENEKELFSYNADTNKARFSSIMVGIDGIKVCKISDDELFTSRTENFIITSPSKKLKYDWKGFTISMPIDEARKAKMNTACLVVFNLSTRNELSTRFIGFQESNHMVFTFIDKYIFAKNIEIWFYNKKTRRVYFKYSFDETLD